jgi:hypothetical protein
LQENRTAMGKLDIVCQDLRLTRKPAPVKNRIEELWYPDEADEITERVQGFSLAREYSSKQLREIKRRRMKKRKLVSRIISRVSRKEVRAN